MRTHHFTDPKLRFESKVEIGKYLVVVSIDGLPKCSFPAKGLMNFIYNNASASATLLQFHNCDEWKMPLNDMQTLERMREIMVVRGFSSYAAIVKSHINEALRSGDIDTYWRTHLIPEIMQAHRQAGELASENFNATLVWCNPVVARMKLHPRALQFIHSHWPEIVKMHSQEESPIVKLA